MNLNTAIIAGNLTANPELKALENGKHICTFTIATNRTFIVNGEKREDAEFHNIVCFGKMAESVGTHLTKGSLALVEGYLKTRSWEKDGEKRYRTEIIAERVQFGPKKDIGW